MRRYFFVPLAAALLLAGCGSMAPAYKQPALPVANTWPAGLGSIESGHASQATTPVADIAWRQFIVDDKLRELVSLSLQNNRDLRVAVLNIDRARAQFGIQQSESFPSVGLSGSGTSQRLPADVSPSGQAGITRQYSAGAGLSAYELDLFGRVRSLKDEALQRYLATRESRKTVQISLVAEVANTYLKLGADQERLRLARQTLENRSASHDLTQRSHKLGVASMLDVRQAQTLVESARVDVARFTTLIAQDRNALVLLVGGNIPDGLLPQAQADDKHTLAKLDAGLSSEVLRSRPDVLQAEHLLRAANANIGAARAAFFPRISLTAAAGTTSNALSGLFDGGTGFWNFMPQITLPIFDGGRNRASLKVSQADRDIALAQYEKAIQNAFREVADTLAERGTLGEQLRAQEALVEASSANQSLSEARFRRGVDSYLSVLDAQRGLYAAQQDLISLRQTRNSNHVNLYKALGGGWNEAESAKPVPVPGRG